MKRIIFLLCLSFILNTYAKDVVIDFNNPKDFYERYQFVKGVEGLALDLSANAYHRNPYTVNQIDSVDLSSSFTIGVWVKSNCELMNEYAIVSNKKSLDMKDSGFMICSQPNGSWGVYFCDGHNWQQEYKPTVQRQPINDGKWHFLAIAHNAPKQEMKMYYDGKNVATYCTDWNKNLSSPIPLYLGNHVDNQWESFEGYLDHFTFSNRVKSKSEIQNEYFVISGKRVKEKLPKYTKDFNLMGFNIYHGGHELGGQIGPKRVAEVIKESGADIIGMVETYGSGAEIADQLGYYLYLRSSNLSIMSKYPIEETWDFFKPFNCCAVTIRISESQTINYVNLWLDYLPTTDLQIKAHLPATQIEKEELPTRYKELKQILKAMQPMIDQKEIPLFVSGDFNSSSHLDWTEEAKHLNSNYVIKWPTSVLMQENGFIDSYRELYPDPVKYRCLTWSPMCKIDVQYRIDFIYYLDRKVKAIESRMIDQHKVRFPADHAAMITRFKFEQ